MDLVDGDAEGGGVVPFRYRRGAASVAAMGDRPGAHAARAGSRAQLLTTDHPNGGPFTEYPRIIHLLMDKEERDRSIADCPSRAGAHRPAGIEREYASPKSPADAGGAGPAPRPRRSRPSGAGARADVAIYRDNPDRTAMFSTAMAVLKDGVQVVEEGRQSLLAARAHYHAVARL